MVHTSEDSNPQKVNLGIGVYRTSDGNPWPLRVVQEAEKVLFQASDINRHEYLAIQGDADFLSLAADLVFGFGDYQGSSMHDTEKVRQRVVSIQTVSGTGANRLRRGTSGPKHSTGMRVDSEPYMGQSLHDLGPRRCAEERISLL